MQLDGNDATATFTLNAGETATLAFGQIDEERAGVAVLDPANVDEHFQETSRFWRSWIGRSNYTGRWREMVNRSALMLKLLCSEEYGSLIAAPTFALPEQVGGERNWDYRYTWLRDSSFSLYAFMRLGFVEEARAFTHWIRDRLQEDAEHGPLQVMYHPDGRQELDEDDPRFTLRATRTRAPSASATAHTAAPARHLRRVHGRRLPCQQIR